MRHDMAKVVTERPRYRSSWPNRSTRWHLNPNQAGKLTDEDREFGEFGPSRMPCSHYSKYGGKEDSGHKYFSDLLGPLRNFLRKQVGRAWNDVYSELSAI